MQFFIGLLIGIFLAQPRLIQKIRWQIADSLPEGIRRRESISRNQKLFLDWKAGISWEELISKYGVNRARVRQILAKFPEYDNGKAQYVQQNSNDGRNQKIREQYAAGRLLREIADEFDLNPSTISGIIHNSPNNAKLRAARDKALSSKIRSSQDMGV